MRIYIVNDKTNDTTRLVEAPNPAQALRHVTLKQFDVSAASAIEVAKLMSTGVKLETIADNQRELELETTEN